MHYTVHKDPHLDSLVQSDLDVICQRLQSSFDAVEGIILVGGFGRGEGGLVLKGDRYRPENDYDLEMITPNIIDTNKLKSIEKELAEQLGVRWVHIENRSLQALPKLPFTQYVFDLKYGGHVVYGPTQLLNAIPNMNPAFMPIAEGEKLLHTRLWCFLGAFTDSFCHRQPTPAEASFLISQMSKALLAICDAELMLRGAYQVSYQNKVQHFVSRVHPSNALQDLAQWALQYKLHPETAPHPDPLPLFYNTRNHFLDCLFRFAQTVRRCRFDSWQSYAAHFHGWVLPNPRIDRIKRIVKMLLGRSSPDSRYIDMVRLKLLMAVAQNPEHRNMYLPLCRQIAGRYQTEDTQSWDWETLRLQTLTMLGI